MQQDVSSSGDPARNAGLTDALLEGRGADAERRRRLRRTAAAHGRRRGVGSPQRSLGNPLLSPLPISSSTSEIPLRRRAGGFCAPSTTARARCRAAFGGAFAPHHRVPPATGARSSSASSSSPAAMLLQKLPRVAWSDVVAASKAFERACSEWRFEQAIRFDKTADCCGRKLIRRNGTHGRSRQMRVLVTGAAGFIGSHVVERLVAEGHSVRAFVRSVERAQQVLPREVELALGDVRDQGSLVRAADGIRCVVHTAARTTDWGPWAEFEATTVQGTQRTVEAACRAGVERLVLVSTTAVYDAAVVRSGHVTEDAPRTQDRGRGNRYGYAKALAEERVLAAHAAGKLKVTVLRPGWVYGPRDRTMFPRILEFLRDPTSVWISGHDPNVALVYVTDVADAISRATTNEAAPGRAFNVSAIEGCRLRWLAERIAEQAGLHAPTRSVPLAVAQVAAAVVEDFARLLGRKQPPSLTRFALALMLEGNPYDVTQARTILDWKPKVGPADGIARMVQWAREQRLL